jgi:serine/threonine protein kinase/ABC-type branched-subunit amino acid transport system substrate-binding protein
VTYVASPRLELGKTLQERYRVVRFLGRGGMGFVYLCEDLRLPGKHWALKEMILHDPGVAEQVRDSFIREAQFLAGLRHRSLPTIVDVFTASNRQYLVMEFIEGETLAQRVDNQGVPSDSLALSWALELAQVLDYLHRQDRPIIFRDLKPENIMINTEGHIKVIDFGLARHFEPGKRRDTQASGTVGYAPPEQWEDSGQSDGRSDIYSLAATLYFVLTGRPPSPIYGSHRIRPYRPDIDPGIEALVLKCLQPDPAQRYASAAELIKDLLILLSEDKHQGALHNEEFAGAKPEPSAEARTTRPKGKAPSLKAPLSFPKRLPSLLGISLVLFMVGLLLPFVDWNFSVQPPPNTEDHMAEILSQTAPTKAEARVLLEDGKYEEAIALLDSLFTKFPQDPETLILKNNAYAAFSGSGTYKIPVLSSWHGSEREGIQLLHGFALAQTNLNKDRLNNKQPLIILDLYDDRSNNEKLLSIAKNLALDENTNLILGPYTSQQTRLIAPIANSQGVPVLAPVASDPQVLSTGRFVFSAADSDNKKLQAQADYLYDTGSRKVAIFMDGSNIISRSLGDAFMEAFQEKGGQIAVAEEYPVNQVDFTELIQSARDNGADCVFLAEYRMTPVINFCDSLRANDWSPKVATQTAVFSDTLFRRGKEVVDGLILSTYYVPEEGGPRSKAFSREFRRTFTLSTPTHREVAAYDILMLAVEALDTVGPNRDKIRAFFTEIGSERPAYKGISGEFAVSQTLGARPAYILKVENGEYILVGELP